MCVPKTSTMFNKTVLLLGTVKCCKSHSASCVRTNTSDTRVVAKCKMVTLLIGGCSIVDSRRIFPGIVLRLSAVAGISSTQMVIAGSHCSSDVLSACSAFIEPIYNPKPDLERVGGVLAKPSLTVVQLEGLVHNSPQLIAFF